MRAQRKFRLYILAGMFFSFAIAASLILYAFRQNMNAFYTPQQLLASENYKGQTVQLGGVVVAKSIRYQGVIVYFKLADKTHQISVHYQGLLPDLFREGQTAIIRGQLQKNGIFKAIQVLAKHDENYRPLQLQG